MSYYNENFDVFEENNIMTASKCFCSPRNLTGFFREKYQSIIPRTAKAFASKIYIFRGKFEVLGRNQTQTFYRKTGPCDSV